MLLDLETYNKLGKKFRIELKSAAAVEKENGTGIYVRLYVCVWVFFIID